MSIILRCSTLFDITNTGITNRDRYSIRDTKEWEIKRNSQCNFDTILQVISLRSQPEIIQYPKMEFIKIVRNSKFGNNYINNKKQYRMWFFDFGIMHTDVFANESSELGLLYGDCEHVPMIKLENNNIVPYLDTSDKYRNIYFEVINNET
jgi:hypothetical protein